MSFFSKFINIYPPPLPGEAGYILPSGPTISPCNPLITVQAQVLQTEGHTLEWEQVAGPSVPFTVSPDMLSLSFVRVVQTNHIFRLYIDRYTSIEVFQDFTVTDLILSDIAPHFTTDYITGGNTIEGTQRDGPELVLTVDQSAPEGQWTYSPVILSWTYLRPEGFLRYDVYEYDNPDSAGTLVATQLGYSVRATYTGTVGKYYRVRAVTARYTTTSKMVQKQAPINYTGLGPSITDKGFMWERYNITLSNNSITADQNVPITRKVKLALQKLEATRIDPTLTTAITTFDSGAVVNRYGIVTKQSQSRVDPVLTNQLIPDFLAGSLNVTRLNGSGIGAG